MAGHRVFTHSVGVRRAQEAGRRASGAGSARRPQPRYPEVSPSARRGVDPERRLSRRGVVSRTATILGTCQYRSLTLDGKALNRDKIFIFQLPAHVVKHVKRGRGPRALATEHSGRNTNRSCVLGQRSANPAKSRPCWIALKTESLLSLWGRASERAPRRPSLSRSFVNVRARIGSLRSGAREFKADIRARTDPHQSEQSSVEIRHCQILQHRTHKNAAQYHRPRRDLKPMKRDT